MNNRPPFALSSLAVAFFVSAGGLAPVAKKWSVERMQQAEVKVTLMRLEESRRVKLVDEDDGSFDFNKPGLVLMYGLELPADLNVHAVSQPEQIEATDDAGTDLTQIEAGFMGDREYVELEHAWDGPPSSFEIRLKPSARSASTFSLKATFELDVFGDTESITLNPDEQWQPIDATLFPSDTVRARLNAGGFGGNQAQFALRPGIARDVIDSVYLIDGDDEVQSMSVMWSDQEAVFGFDHPHREGQRIRLIIRTDVQRVPITIDLRDQPLP